MKNLPNWLYWLTCIGLTIFMVILDRNWEAFSAASFVILAIGNKNE